MKLVGVGRQVGQLVRGFEEAGVIVDPASLRASLLAYAEALAPWAKSIAERMQAQVSQQDLRAWRQFGAEIGRALHREVEEAPTGLLRRNLMDEQVLLIKSLPLEAAQRVHHLTREAQLTGRRAAEIADEIRESGNVTIGRAKLIARTEVARTSSLLVQARAQHIGSEGYVWRTRKDSDVRPALSMPPAERARFIGSHRALEGRFIRWDDPPISGSGGQRAHAGQIFNCRCWPEPQIPDL
jgi:uncharacterized protein with gpF-like domain